MKDLGLYIHIPFCKSKCYYCDFCSYKNMDNLIEIYLQSLIKEIVSYKDKMQSFNVKTIYIGGGTPSYIPEEYIEMIVDAVYKNYCVDSDLEFSIEVNPGTVNKKKFEAYKSAGINRISFGLQSTSNDMLKNIGRIHTFEEFCKNYYLAREKGFDNISIDLMFGMPNQTLDLWLETLDNIIKLKPEHISTYALKVEENTLFYRLYQNNKLDLPPEEIERNMFHKCIEKLKCFGYNHYEISNFALAGFESKHNMAYWKRHNYLGLGLNSASCIDEVRFSNETDIKKYIEKINNNEMPIVYREVLDDKEIFNEKVILYLRLLYGTNIDEILENEEDIVKEKFIKNMDYLIKIGLIERFGDKINLSVRGIDLSNQVFIKLTDI